MEWMRVNYASFVLMWIRREIDAQANTVNLNQLLGEIERRPGVITRERRRRISGMDRLSPLLSRMLDDEFTRNWVRVQQPGAATDSVDSAIVANDRTSLRDVAGHAEIIANQTVAHRVRVSPAALTVPQVDVVFDAVETILTKYYALLRGASLVGLEPTPQFDTNEVFTFVWIQPSAPGQSSER